VRSGLVIGLVIGTMLGAVLVISALTLSGGWYAYHALTSSSAGGRTEFQLAQSTSGTTCEPITVVEQVWFKCPRVRL
jgi:hypothetical protein